jgi:acyl dehydratase
MGLNEALAGKRYPETKFEVTQKQIEDYSQATNDGNERYVGPYAIASPVFLVVPAFPSFMAAATDPDLGADMLRLVHGSEEHIIHRQVRVGDGLTVTPVLESVATKDTGETFTVLATETDERGELVAEVRGTMFIRGTGDRRRAAAAAAAGGETPGDIIYEETTVVEADQTFRYAEASGDHNPIHLDPDTARAAGLPGVILHGMCTMAFATKAAVNGPAGGDPARITRVAVQFSRPVLPGQKLTTVLWGGRGGEYGLVTYNAAGKPVIRGGRVEIAAL